MSRPVDPGRPGDVGMAAEPLAGKRAPRHDRQALGDRVVDRGSHEPAPDAAAGQRAVNLGMGEDEPIVETPEHQLGGPLGERELEALGSIVANDRGGHAGGNGVARMGVPVYGSAGVHDAIRPGFAAAHRGWP